MTISTLFRYGSLCRSGDSFSHVIFYNGSPSPLPGAGKRRYRFISTSF